VLGAGARMEGRRDSKRVSRREGVRLARVVRARALAWAVGRVGAAGIDTDDVLQATWQAMRRALERLGVAPGLVLVDGHLRIPRLAWPQRALVQGDRRSASIAAASIVAKVARDAFMVRADRRYPAYGFHRHKGYRAAAHLG